MKYFIITVDTEGDNLWRYKDGDIVETRNAEYIPRFQQLCEQYGFKPVYLTNYEMANSDVFVKNAKEWQIKNNCEIGLHLHAWNNPPLSCFQGPFSGNPYLIEYPDDVMRQKFKVVYDLIVEKFGIKPVSHRAGRWAMDDRYFKILKDFGFRVDCSHTPGINWGLNKGKTIGGTDYSNVKNGTTIIDGILEVPPSIYINHRPFYGSFKNKIRTIIKGEKIWLRPASSSVEMMEVAIKALNKRDDVDYVQFMIHSSELMPDGSPYFVSAADVENEYETIETFFQLAEQLGYIGITLRDYSQLKKQ